ncbi:MAG: DedA family protein [Desulfobacterales bacterium]|nr:DedA family protein [Desulfobacterales bacterium]MDD4070938.1 DedA family protein [Desulfobacterales bacterium]MDD4393436.1 DedA family protein [Desulfobacterales bacterium]
MLRNLYDWILKWAQTPYGTWALFILAFCESSFFPIPPDILLIAMAIAAPARSFSYALICSVGSVTGGCLGYFIGWQFMAGIGDHIIRLYGLADKFDYIQALYIKYDAWAIAVAGFTPIPYKVFTISAGAFDINFLVFTVASAVSRSARFFLIGALIYTFGAKIQTFIDKYFNMLAVGVTVLIVAGFALIKYLF